jgi:hypothetical protein
VGHRDGNIAHHVHPEYEHTAVINNLDLRGAEVPPKEPNEFRILALGDSFTYGLGVDEKDTFVRQTERILRNRIAESNAQRTIRVINGGVASGPYVQFAWLLERGLELQPDLVVQTFYIGNDIYDDRLWLEASGEIPPSKAKDVPIVQKNRRLQEKSLALDWLWGQLSQVPIFDRILFRMGLRYRDRGLFLKDQPQLETQAWKMTLDKLLETHQTLQGHGIRWILMIAPTSDQVRFGSARPDTEDYRLPNETLTNFLVNHRIEFIDLLPLMEIQKGSDRFYFNRDPHWTGEGHRFAAEVLADKIEFE